MSDSDGAPSLHPLLASTVIAGGDLKQPPGEDQLWVDCPQCERHQSLAEGDVEPAEDPQDITEYRCATGCTTLLATGHPNPVPLEGSGRYRFGDYALTPLAPTGLLIRLSSGREIRLGTDVRSAFDGPPH